MITISNTYQSMKLGNILNFASKKMETAQLRLTTGLRINSAKDDPAGLGMAVQKDVQIRGSEVAKQNSLYAKNITDSIGSAVSIINDKYGEIKELAIKAQGALSDEQKAAYGEEAKQIYNSIVSLQATVMKDFNAPSDIATAKNSTTTFQIGWDSGAYSTKDVKLFAWVMPENTMTATDFDFTDEANITATMTKTEAVMKDTLMPEITKLGATSKILAENADLQDVNIINLSAAKSRIVDADMAREASELTKYEIMAQSAAALLVQSQNFNAGITLSLIAGSRIAY